jgi:hypothetical protein
MNAIRCCVLGVVVAVPLAVLPDDAGTKTVGVLAVSPAPGPGPALVDLTSQLREQLVTEPRAGLSVLDTTQLRLRMGELAADTSLADTNRSYEAAIGADLSNDPERAIAILKATVEALESLPEGEEAFQQWTRAMLRLAKIESQLAAYEKEAPVVMERLLRAEPRTKVDPEVHGSDLVRQFETVRAQIRALPDRRLSISSQSKGVAVFVNGRPVGSAAPGSPLLLTLKRGQYRVTGYQGKLRAPPQKVELVEKDQTLTLDFSLPEVLRPNQGPGLALAADDHRQILRAGGYLRLDTVVTTSMSEEEGISYLFGTLYDVPAGKLKLSGVMRLNNQRPDPGGIKALADFLTSSSGSKLVRPYDPLDPSRKPFREVFPPEPSKTKGWVAFGTGLSTVALGGVAVWQMLASNKAFDDARAMLATDGSVKPPNTVADYNRKLNDGNSSRNIAIGAGVGAGAAVITTGVLGYLSYKQTGEVGPFRF